MGSAARGEKAASVIAKAQRAVEEIVLAVQTTGGSGAEDEAKDGAAGGAAGAESVGELGVHERESNLADDSSLVASGGGRTTARDFEEPCAQAQEQQHWKPRPEWQHARAEDSQESDGPPVATACSKTAVATPKTHPSRHAHEMPPAVSGRGMANEYENEDVMTKPQTRQKARESQGAIKGSREAWFSELDMADEVLWTASREEKDPHDELYWRWRAQAVEAESPLLVAERLQKMLARLTKQGFLEPAPSPAPSPSEPEGWSAIAPARHATDMNYAVERVGEQGRTRSLHSDNSGSTLPEITSADSDGSTAVSDSGAAPAKDLKRPDVSEPADTAVTYVYQ
jgi:hypothetical protein